MNKENSLSFFGMIIAGFFALLPFITSRNLFYATINAKYFFVIGFISLLSIYLSYLITTKKIAFSLKKQWLLLLLVISLIMHYLSAFSGVFPTGSLKSDILRSAGVFFLTYVALFSFIISQVLSFKNWILVRRSIAVSSGILAFLMFFGKEGLNIGGSFLGISFTTNGLTMGNNTFAGTYLLLGVIVTLIEIIRSRPKSGIRKVFIGLFIVQILSPILFNAQIWLGKVAISEVFSNPILILGEARSSSAVAFLVLFYFLGLIGLQKLFSSKEKIKKYVVPTWAGIWVLAILGSISLLFVQGSFIQKAYVEQSSAARLIVWQIGIEAFKEKPILGWGPENFRFALAQHFDNRLYLEENIGEIWFDKAHNVVIDSLVNVGILGVLTLFLLWLYFLIIVIKASRKGIISYLEANLLGIFVFGHFLQLQTSFDTISSYVFVGFILGYGLWLERQILKNTLKDEDIKQNSKIRFIFGAFMLFIAIFGSYSLLAKEYIRQHSLHKIFRSTNAEEQLKLIDKALADSSRFENLRFPFLSFIQGAIPSIGQSKNPQQTTMNVLNQLHAYERHYKEYLTKAPLDYRANIELAYSLLIATVLGEKGRLEEAQEIVDNSYSLSPQNPLTYAVDSLIQLYRGDIEASKSKINEVIVLYPEIEFSKEILSYIEEQEKNLPNIKVIMLKNL